ncbi:MAG TPA: protein phosphatase 2C domain-containing protein [Kofleriaceae bacterium]|nr:protein phosphatase 2C domain-containing protein [Kofleriaceae bacterium]
MKLDAVMVTDVGVVRDHNEDSAHVDPARRFFIVADGMGGHAAGEVASAMAVESVKKTLEASTSIIDAFSARPTDTSRRALVQLLQGAVLSAHQAVFQRGARESDKAGMGTTLDVVLIAGREAFVAHVGDSRTYLIREGKAAQLTTDHTVAEVLVIEGKLTIEEAMVSPYRTVLVNAIGVAADVGVEMAHLQLRQGDKLLVCSDGLHDYFLAEQEIADTLSEGETLQALGGMVETAKERGGHDNITGVVVSVVELQDSVPGSVDGDDTAPVDVADDGFDADERTENISPRDLDKLGLEPLRPARGRPVAEPERDAARSTAPMLVVTPPGSDARGSDATDPGIEAPPDDGSDVDEAMGAPLQRVARAEDPTMPAAPALPPAQRKRSLERASTMPPPVGDAIAPQGPPPIPGLTMQAGPPPMPASEAELPATAARADETPGDGKGRAAASDAGGGAEGDAVPTDSLALGDTGPLPKVDS